MWNLGPEIWNATPWHRQHHHRKRNRPRAHFSIASPLLLKKADNSLDGAETTKLRMIRIPLFFRVHFSPSPANRRILLSLERRKECYLTTKLWTASERCYAESVPNNGPRKLYGIGARGITVSFMKNNTQISFVFTTIIASIVRLFWHSQMDYVHSIFAYFLERSFQVT